MAATSTGSSGGRPMIMGTHAVVSSGHYLATEAGLEILRRGGNAFDAAAAVGFALAVVKPQENGFGGEAPTLVYSARERKVHAVSGHGTAPAAATIQLFRELGIDMIPGDGFLAAVVPCVPATWILVLERFGTMRLADVLAPAIGLAGGGFPVYDGLRESISGAAERFRNEWPSSAEVFTPGGRVPECGAIWRNPALARTLKRLARAEGRFRKRKDGLRAAHDEFYRGPIAEAIVKFARNTAVKDASGKSHTCLLTVEDFNRYQAQVEKPVSVRYRGVNVYKCSSWTQGPVMLQALTLLEGYNLRDMGLNSADYIHTVTECMKLAFADREFCYGDPDFVRVPFRRLLSRAYARERRHLVDAGRASMDLRPGGMPAIRPKSVLDVDAEFAKRTAAKGGRCGDTTKLEVIDAAGNMVSTTPSGGWHPSSPVIPGLGFPLGTRAQMFSLVEGHPNCLKPGKRPRTTLTPTLSIAGNGTGMAFGSPGGDAQDQWALQFFLNVVEFGMSLQEAVEAPTFWTDHFPSSFYPRTADPGSLNIEKRIPAAVIDELKSRGHVAWPYPEWSGGNTHAASFDPKTKVLSAAATPRDEPSYAAGW